MLRRIISCVLSGVLLLSASALFAATPAAKVKAAYIYQFTQFVSWPDTAVAADTPFTICVLGDAPVGNELKPLESRQVNGRPIKIRYPKNLKAAASCQILYLAETKQQQLRNMLKRFFEQPILTISSLPNFATRGGIIGFVTTKKRVRMEINRTAARRANIQLSAKLLEVARVIDSHDTGEERL